MSTGTLGWDPGFWDRLLQNRILFQAHTLISQSLVMSLILYEGSDMFSEHYHIDIVGSQSFWVVI